MENKFLAVFLKKNCRNPTKKKKIRIEKVLKRKERNYTLYENGIE